MVVGLSLVLGGALGNLIDRLFRTPGFLKGAVVDFVHVARSPRSTSPTPPSPSGRSSSSCGRCAPTRVSAAPESSTAEECACRMAEQLAVPEALAGERLDRAVALLTGWTRREVQDLVDERVGARRREAGRQEPQARGRRASIELLGEPEVAGLPAARSRVDVDGAPRGRRRARGRQARGPRGAPRRRSSPTARWSTACSPATRRSPHVGDPARPGIVHRLDRDTSGLLVVARSPPAYDGLVEMLAAHDVERATDALGLGRTSTAPPRRHRRARSAARCAAPRAWRCARAVARARTAYEVVRAAYREPGVSLLACRLETGRTHQIRVHLQAIGHPVVGDASYGGARPGLDLDRPFLHATAVAFAHPVTGERIVVEEPLPPELTAVLDELL